MATRSLVVGFTDWVGSTALRTAIGDTAADELQREHDRLVRDAVGAAGGRVVKGTGDGALVTFESAVAAVAAMSDLQQRLRDRTSSGAHPIEMRIGLTAGEVAEERDDVFGLVVNAAARLCDAAATHQVLVSSEVRGLLGTRAELPLVPVGELALKGLGEPLEAFAVRWTDDAPTWLKDSVAVAGSSGQALPGSVPSPATSFIGRQAELAELADLVKEHRIITMLGPGGIGKTRLSIEVARSLTGAFRDGAWFVDLSALTDDRAVSTAVLKTLGVADDPDAGSRDQLVRFLTDRQVLLVLDNCEQLVASVAEIVDRLVRETDGVTVLATSRERLSVPGEHVWTVPTVSSEDAEDDAVRLFVDRATAAGARLTDHDRDDVVALCRTLDGLPLAIELAAARCRSMNPGKVLQRLQARPDAALGRTRTGPERQRTIEGLVAWSVELLDDTEQLLFARLGIFHGSFPLEAAEAVCTCDVIDEFDVLDLLDALVDKSLVQTEPGPAGDTRYRLLFTIRTHAANLLAPHDRVERTRRLLGWLIDRFAEGTEGLKGPAQNHWHATLTADHDLLRHALQRSDDGHDPTRVHLAATAAYYWDYAGHDREALALTADLLDDDTTDDLDAALLRTCRASILWRQGRYDEAEPEAAAARTALGGCEPVPDHIAFEVALNEAIREGDHQERADEAIALARSQGDTHRIVRALIRWIRVTVNQRWDPRRRRDVADEAVRLASEIQDDYLLSLALTFRGWAAWTCGQGDEAVTWHERAVATAAALGIPTRLLDAELRHGDALVRVDRTDDAMPIFQNVHDRAARLGLPSMLFMARYMRATALISNAVGRVDVEEVSREQAVAAAALCDDLLAESIGQGRSALTNCANMLAVAAGLLTDGPRARRALAHTWVRLTDPLNSTMWFWGAPYVASALGEHSAAVTLIRAGDEPMKPFHDASDYHGLTVLEARARAALTDAEFAEAEAAGETMTIAEAAEIVAELLAPSLEEARAQRDAAVSPGGPPGQ